MKKMFIIMVFILNTALLSVTINTANAAALFTPSSDVNEKLKGRISSINYIKRNINIGGKSYKLSKSVKVYGFNGNKFLNVKKLSVDMEVSFKYATRKGIITISEIWVKAL